MTRPAWVPRSLAVVIACVALSLTICALVQLFIEIRVPVISQDVSVTGSQRVARFIMLLPLSRGEELLAKLAFYLFPCVWGENFFVEWVPQRLNLLKSSKKMKKTDKKRRISTRNDSGTQRT